MEQAAGVRYHMTGTDAGQTVAGCPVLIRVSCPSGGESASRFRGTAC
jgi:hypothetical protein